jgi:hypothetical protein
MVSSFMVYISCPYRCSAFGQFAYGPGTTNLQITPIFEQGVQPIDFQKAMPVLLPMLAGSYFGCLHACLDQAWAAIWTGSQGLLSEGSSLNRDRLTAARASG